MPFPLRCVSSTPTNALSRLSWWLYWLCFPGSFGAAAAIPPASATLDYGAGHGGPATAYRWDGERHLDAEKFVQSSSRKEAGPYEVSVDDNYHFMDEDERYRSGLFSTYDDALARAKQIVDRYLQDVFETGKSAADLESSYKMFGEDPWIKPTPESMKHVSA